MDQTGRVLQLIGTFLPLYGVILTIILGVTLRKGWRIAALVLTPLLTYWLCSYFGKHIGNDGNMLFVVLLGFFMLAMCVYYPVLLIAGIVHWFKRNRQSKNNNN